MHIIVMYMYIFLEIIEDSRDNLVMAMCWLLIIMMFLDAHYDDVHEQF